MCRPDEFPPYDPDAAPNRVAYERWRQRNIGPFDVGSRVTSPGPWRGPTEAEWLARFQPEEPGPNAVSPD